MKDGTRAAIAAILLCFAADTVAGAPSDAQNATAEAPTIGAMRARDRFAAPKAELAAWKHFAAASGEAGPELRAEIHARLSIAHFYAGSYAEGWAEAEKAERLIAAHGLEKAPFVPELLAYGALLSTDLGNLERAAAYAARALSAAQALFGDDSAEAGLAYNSLAYIDFAQGNMASAEKRMCAAADRTRRHLPAADPMVSNNLISCAVARYYLDDPGTADAIRAAAAFAHANLPPNHPKLALALNSSSGILTALGHYSEAEQVLMREIALIRSSYGDNHPDLYSSLSLLGRVLSAQGKLEEAAVVMEEGAALAHRVDHKSDPSIRGQSKLNLAQLHARTGRFDRALALQREGLQALTADLKKGHVDIGSAQIGLAALLLRGGAHAEALGLARTGRDIVSAGLPEHHKDRLAADIAYAEILVANGRPAEAFAIARPASEQLERRLVDLAVSRSELVSLSPIMVAGFSRYAQVALAAGQEEAAVRAAQMASLSELNLVNAELAARHAAAHSGAGDLLAALRERKLEAGQLRRRLARAEADGDPATAGISRKLDEAEAESSRLVGQIETLFPAYRVLGRPRPASLEEIRAWLAPRQALVLPLALDGRTLTILVGRYEVAFAEQSKGSFQPLIARVAHSIGAFATDPDPGAARFDAGAAHALYRLVFPAALEARLAAYDELLFPASGPLAALSPALLLRAPKDSRTLAGAAWLVRTHRIAIVSGFAEHRGGAGTSGGRGFVGIGGPLVGPAGAEGVPAARLFPAGAPDGHALRSLPRLNGAAGELRRMAASFPAAATLLLTGAEATEARVKALDFSPYAVATFATHGLTSGELNGLNEPALVLTAPDPAQGSGDGLLTASEIARLDIPVEWVILSACNSGGGNAASSPVYSGLARAFRLAGARSLLLSHWPVRDDAAARLGADTVRGAAGGLPRAEALRRAMVGLMDDSSITGSAHPAVWAAFILVAN
jgi:hypothetical protein